MTNDNLASFLTDPRAPKQETAEPPLPPPHPPVGTEVPLQTPLPNPLVTTSPEISATSSTNLPPSEEIGSTSALNQKTIQSIPPEAGPLQTTPRKKKRRLLPCLLLFILIATLTALTFYFLSKTNKSLDESPISTTPTEIATPNRQATQEALDKMENALATIEANEKLTVTATPSSTASTPSPTPSKTIKPRLPKSGMSLFN